MRRVLAAVAAAFLLAAPLGACGMFGDREVSNPVAAAETVDTKVLASYGLVTIALEEAATLAEQDATPNSVVAALNRAAPAVLASANIARSAAVEYRHARVAYDAAVAGGLNDTTALVATLAQSGIRLNAAIADLKRNLETLRGAFGGRDVQALEDATAVLEEAEALPQVEAPAP